MRVLVTGGTGYIGSHTLLELIQSGHTPIVIDNLSNSSIKSLRRVEGMTGEHIEFYAGDIRDKDLLRDIFSDNQIDAVIDFAAYKSVGQSVLDPIEYFDNNIVGLISLISVMDEFSVGNLIFSSSATVYGDSENYPFKEDETKGIPTNPYGRTKSMAEDMLSDLMNSSGDWNIVILRYFNPVGAHPSGKIGEDPNGVPANLMPYITKVAIGELPKLKIFGDDYHTCDGTGVRDYIHVVDLARAHVSAIDSLNDGHSQFKIYNVGTGFGTSVLNLVKIFEEVNDVKIPYEVVGRRPGDVDISFCDIEKIKAELGWKPIYSVKDMCRDAYKWQVNNLKGYGK